MLSGGIIIIIIIIIIIVSGGARGHEHLELVRVRGHDLLQVLHVDAW